ncbi:hypothetical protein N5T66_04210 [Aliarcobacter cryaerophilus]|uniref:hypothetical protein n=1 Tax=Aliarcobacter cryaerophilus TaxID=28198 RepID=UPI0021B4BECF|nr:hypothetical protein [Aliarcobacter cryaerophilus]MCT7432475.1 hypothetical protein [Aliarcobacter cryaerophilus]
MKVNDLTELRKITKEIKELTTKEIKIGIAADVGTYDDGTKIVTVGRWHEYGLGDNPRRSFLRVPMIDKQFIIQKHIKDGWSNILSGKGTALNELGKLGMVGQEISKGAFSTGGYGKWEKLNPQTIKRKGSSEILIDTSKLVNSIHNWIVDK